MTAGTGRAPRDTRRRVLDRASSDQLNNGKGPTAGHGHWVAAGRSLLLVLAALVFIADRVTKGVVVAHVPFGTERSVLPYIWITNTQNSGAAFGVAQEATTFFLAASVIVAVGVVLYAVKTPIDMWTGALLGLILGGTVGNGYDRLLHGSVTDFIALHFWPVFNVADSAISVGVVLLLAGYLLRQRAEASP